MAWSVARSLHVPLLLTCEVVALVAIALSPRHLVAVMGSPTTRQLVWPMVPWVLSVPTGSLVALCQRPTELLSVRGRVNVGAIMLGALAVAVAALVLASPGEWRPTVFRNSCFMIGLALLVGPAVGRRAVALPGLLLMIAMWVLGTDVESAAPWAALFRPGDDGLAMQRCVALLVVGLAITAVSLVRVGDPSRSLLAEER